MTDADKVRVLRAALEGVMPILTGPEPTPRDLKEWARRVIDAEYALIRTRPLDYVEGAGCLADLITRES